MIKIKQAILNEAYNTVNNQYKSGIILTDHVHTYIDPDTKLDFIFDNTIGVTGRWICVSDIELIDADDD